MLRGWQKVADGKKMIIGRRHSVSPTTGARTQLPAAAGARSGVAASVQLASSGAGDEQPPCTQGRACAPLRPASSGAGTAAPHKARSGAADAGQPTLFGTQGGQPASSAAEGHGSAWTVEQAACSSMHAGQASAAAPSRRSTALLGGEQLAGLALITAVTPHAPILRAVTSTWPRCSQKGPIWSEERERSCARRHAALSGKLCNSRPGPSLSAQSGQCLSGSADSNAVKSY